MTEELSYEASELFRSARTGLSPSGDDLARGRRRLAAAIAAGGVSLGAAATTTAKAGTLASGLMVVAVVAGGVTAGAAWWSRSQVVEPTAPVVAAPTPETAAAPSIVAAEIAPPVIVVPAAPSKVVAPAPVLRPHVEEVRPSIEEVPAVVPPAPAEDGLARELELVRSADAALRAGDAARALTLSRADNVVQLAAELSAIEIDALCSLQRRDEARERVLAFRHHFPYSALAERVSRSCEGSAR